MYFCLQTAFSLPAIIAMSENSNSSQREHVIRLCNTADNNFLVVSKVQYDMWGGGWGGEAGSGEGYQYSGVNCRVMDTLAYSELNVSPPLSHKHKKILLG